MQTLESLGWTSRVDVLPDGLVPARVVAQHRGLLDILTSEGRFRAMLRGSLLDDPPIVGDWVGARLLGDQALIEQALPPSTLLTRRRPGGGAPQKLAANVDLAWILMAPDKDFRPARIDRYVALCHATSITPRVVLSKVDLVDDPAPFLAQLPDARALSTVTGEGLEELREEVAGRTAVVLGSSGVGKSSLLNALLGRAVREIQAVSDVDGRGQHTTTTRDLFALPTGGCVIDTPGLREVGLSADADVGEAFPDIAQLASGCAYRDCTHVDEPGCAVLQAVDDGDLPASRLASWRKLQRELASEKRRSDARLRKAEGKRFGRMVREATRDRRRRRGD